ncbi:MAG: YbaB/EbfC family nucleoid-associated protein [Deltaproteobacteria bacterium]|nr:YbaB/EbfC family nucleoid-associated protein [Deltaproteobacteria bacterium]
MNFNKMMKQAQKLQQELAKQQEDAAKQTFEASSGGGMVTAKVNGRNELMALQIEPDVVNRDDIPMLQDLIVAAVNEANRRAQEALQSNLSSMMGGLKIPGLF